MCGSIYRTTKPTRNLISTYERTILEIESSICVCQTMSIVIRIFERTVRNTIIEGSKAKTAEIAVMNSCQMIGEKEIEQGADFLEIMKKNLEALKSALE